MGRSDLTTTSIRSGSHGHGNGEQAANSPAEYCGGGLSLANRRLSLRIPTGMVGEAER